MDGDGAPARPLTTLRRAGDHFFLLLLRVALQRVVDDVAAAFFQRERQTEQPVHRRPAG